MLKVWLMQLEKATMHMEHDTLDGLAEDESP